MDELSLKTKVQLRTRPQSTCLLCGTIGTVLYASLQDHLYGVGGEWSERQCTNPQCKLVWLDPVPLEEDLSKAYANYFTHAVGLNSFGYRLRQRLKRGYAGLAFGYKDVTLWEKILALPIFFMPTLKEQVIYSGVMYLRGERTGKVLEIGFGNGSLLNNLRALGWQTEGIDFDPGAVKSAAENYGLSVKLGSLESQQYASESFDAIVMSHVIEHIPDPFSLIRECYRVLTPGGQLILSTPNVESLGHQTFQENWLSLDPPRHLHLFSLRTIRALVEECGFGVTELKSSSRGAGSIWSASTKLRQKERGIGITAVDPALKWQAKVFEWKETFQLLRDPQAGEELVLMAQKK